MKTEQNADSGLKGTVKSFIYLDTDKVYSISSQLFRGLTEYILTNSGKSISEEEKHKEILGNELADIIVQTQNHQERKYLHDYAYTLFEERLIQEGQVLAVSKENVSTVSGHFASAKFVKVTGRVFFNDSARLAYTMKNFNQIGFALGYITIPTETADTLKETVEKAKSITDRNKRAVVKDRINKTLDLKKHFASMGLQKDEEWLNQLVFLLEYGYGGSFEIQMPFLNDSHEIRFSTILNRGKFKDEPDNIIRKYNRETERSFTIFGIPTQILKSS